MRIAVTGANGFIGRNLVAYLGAIGQHRVRKITRQSSEIELIEEVLQADIIFHLAGVNRPPEEEEFERVNVGLTKRICEALLNAGRATPIVFSSSIQAALDNPYGRSKREAEAVLTHYAEKAHSRVAIYRLPNVFGKWCRPNYNSVVATFCYNIARGLPITVSDPARELELVYIDDVVAALVSELELIGQAGVVYRYVPTTHHITLGQLAEVICSFKAARDTLVLPRFDDPLVHKLYATYLSYLEPGDFAYELDQRVDARGALAEFVKSAGFGQLFVSRTKPGVTRGNHYHHTKTEKFLVVEGEAVVRLRKYDGDEVIEYRVRGEEFRVIDIPPGYTHSIENVGTTDLVTLFWASEVFDPNRPDTYSLPVVPNTSRQ